MEVKILLKPGAIVEFDRKKQFKHIKVLGVGGTGDAHLFEDETTDMLFAFKKYSPKDSNFIEEHYDRFVDEIKILFKISHPNIVRVYNYYLYPEFKLGYLQMEYIDGEAIDEYNPDFSYKNWEDIFTEVVLSFEYLEYKNILHRDIRPANILIDKNHNVKIIDFGFGKKLENKGQNGKSVLLNWPVTQLPDETAKEGIYNHKTEIFFLGKLFQNILGDDLVGFKFEHIIMKMIEIMPAERYSTFIEVSQEISKGVISEINFTDEEKETYMVFADGLLKHISNYLDKYEPINDVSITLGRLASLIRNSSLESYIQDNTKLIYCFINGKYSYKLRNDIQVTTIIDFYNLLNSLVPYKQKIVLDNIYTRLAKIPVKISDDDLPF